MSYDRPQKKTRLVGKDSFDDEFDDEGFDWGAVEKLADSAVASNNSTSFVDLSQTPKNSVISGGYAEKKRAVVDNAGPVVDLSQSPEKPAAVGGYAEKKRAIQNIRPSHWTKQLKTSSSCGPPSPARSVASVASSLQSTLPDTNQAGLPKELRFSASDIEAVTDENLKVLVRHANVSKPLDNGWTLYAHQKRAILSAIRMRHQILALGMGLGKTVVGCCWSRAFVKTFSCKVIVLCPVTLKKDWKRAMEDSTSLTVYDEKEKSNNADVTIASWAKIPSSPEEKYVVVADEAHAMQSMASARTKNSLKLMKNAIGVLLLTGTPLKNGQPSNLFPLLQAVKHPFGRHQKAYELYFCQGREFLIKGRPVWRATGAANLEQLRNCTSSHVLYLTKEECLTDMPPQTRTTRKVSVSAKANLKHSHAVIRLRKAYENQSNNSEAVLGAVQNLRMVDAFAKVDATVQVARSILENEAAVVIFTSFHEVAAAVHNKLSDEWPCELFTGQTPPQKRHVLVDNFQAGSSAVFVATFGVGGVGLTLTAAHTIILLDRPWTPGDLFQAEDRVRRIGQKKPVKSIWISAFELDDQIDQLIISKSNTANAVLAGGNAAVSGGAKISILKLVQEKITTTTTATS